MDEIKKIKKAAKNMRKTALQMGYNSNYIAHYGGGLSIIDILAVLYLGVMHYDVQDPEMQERDRFIMSKGHGTLGLYAALYEVGFISEELLATFQTNEGILTPLTNKNTIIGIEFSNGSLGAGLSFAIGSLLAGRKKGLEYRAFVVLGDGECNEGSIWEATMAASQYKLDNLIAIIDHNGSQSDGTNKEIMNMESLKDKWNAFGWNAIEVDGHNIEQLYQILNELPKNKKPTAIIAHTIKGKGVSFMENNNAWHHTKLTPELYEQALSEIEGEVV